MMTIAEFARLCSCSTQTLRYYDRIGLLRPAQVDDWTGYRYYNCEQALVFIRIKNLQQADFSIDEIRTLLDKPDEEVFAAFGAKIAAQQEKLERMKQIQQTYLREKNDMDKLIQAVSNALVADVDVQAGEAEFLLNPGEGERVAALTREYMADMIARHHLSGSEVYLTVDEETVHGAADALDKVQELEDGIWNHTVLLSDEEQTEKSSFCAADWEETWSCGGWQKAGELFAQMPCVEEGREYTLQVGVVPAKKEIAMTLALFMMGMMLRDKNGRGAIINCNVEDSPDGQNHFSLLRKKI